MNIVTEILLMIMNCSGEKESVSMPSVRGGSCINNQFEKKTRLNVDKVLQFLFFLLLRMKTEAILNCQSSKILLIFCVRLKQQSSLSLGFFNQ